MVTIGRRGGNPVYIPTSRNTMHARANAQLEAHAKAQGEKYTNALQVDAPDFLFWHNHGGSIPCSCSNKLTHRKNSSITPGEVKDEFDQEGLPSAKTKKVSRHRPLGEPIKTVSNRYEEAGFDESAKDKLTDRNEDFFRKGDYSDEDSITRAFATADGSVPDLDPDDPFGILSRKLITCSICMGAGTIDAWQPNAGIRLVLDTSNAYKFFAKGVDVDPSYQPTRISFNGDAKDSCMWFYTLPYLWENVIRTNVYNNDEYVPPSLYEWTWYLPDGSREGILSPDGLEELKEYGGPIHIKLTALENFPMTHAEIIILFAPPMKAQLPEVQKAYEDEFPDYQISVTAELPIGLNIKEGDYLTESKYNRVWKINSINRRITAGGNEFGVSADIRGLMPFEKRLYQFSLFGRPDDYLIRLQKNN